MRLILKSIVLHNFKSYKGTHIIKNIDTSFTAIVGPNGSGKSNVIDSILFVLGFRAKKMRHQQVTDLIYSDGQRETEAFVELIFNKFRIRRSVNVRSSTKYFVDDVETTCANVTKIMMDEGVDMEHNRFLILQGEIESIAMMKPKEGLLEFLENIIGTSLYKKQIEDETLELKGMEQNKTDAQTSLAFIKKDFDHAEALKTQNELAVKEKIDFLIKNNELLNMKNILLSRYKSEAEELKVKLNTEIEELRSTNEETRRIFETYEEKYQKAKKKLNQKEGAFLNAKREYKKTERQNEVQMETKNKLEKKIRDLKEEIKKVERQNEVREREKEIYTKELAENEEELAILYKSTEKNKKKLATTKKKEEYALLKAEEDKLIELIDRKAKMNREKAEVMAQIKCKEEEIKKIEEDLNNLKEKINTIEEFNNEMKNSNNQNFNNNQNVINNDKIFTDQNLINEKLIEIEKDIALTQKELAKRKRRHDEANQIKENALREQEVMNHLKEIKGVLGRLQDVGQVDAGYETALKAACSRMSHVIVDTAVTADKCMEIIKKKNIPRTTLIVLEKIKDVPTVEAMPVPYLFELVECKSMFRKVFYFALTDTLVCSNLKEAERMAFGTKRMRVVTLDGKLIEKSGVMSGGRVVERIKSYEELEKSLERMESIKGEYLEKMHKIEEAKNLCEYKNRLIKMKVVHAKSQEELKKIQDSVSKGDTKVSKGDTKVSKGDTKVSKGDTKVSKGDTKVSKGDTLNKYTNFLHSNSTLHQEIEITKNKIENIKLSLENSLDGELREVQVNLKIESEKIEIYEKRNQEIKIFLTNTPLSTDLKKEEIIQLETRVGKIQIVNTEEVKRKFINLENEYTSLLSTFKESQEEMNNLKKKMGNNYHNEIDLKNKYEDLEEKIGEYEEGIRKNEGSIKKFIKEIEELNQMIEGTVNQGSDSIGSSSKEKGNCLCNSNLCNSNSCNSNSCNPNLLKDFIRKEEKVLSQFIPKDILPGVFEEYKNILSSYEKAQVHYEEVLSLYKSKKNSIEDLKSRRYEEFMEGFKCVSKYLKNIYKSLTYGGNAELELVDYLDPFSEGVVLAVMPPKKCWKNVSNLSGGEKTLSSLSLIFALHKYKPSPFYVMDEIDAALDYRNVSIISNYIQEMTKDSQFVVISLRNDMFEMSRSILGVYKVNNISKFILIDINRVVV